MGILDLLYPARCPVCHGVIRGRGNVCDGCRKKLRYIKEPRCKKCGKQLERQEQEYCRDCMRFSHSFEKGMAVFAYDEIMRRSIAMFKYHNRREYARFYAMEMAAHCGYFLKSCTPEVLIPVPVHRSRKRLRGYNQAELVAKELGKLWKLPVDTTYLIRTEKTTPQKELTRQQRKANLKKAFSVVQGEKAYQRVLLIDDIYTTGATIDAISETLKENQVRKVFFLSICVGRND